LLGGYLDSAVVKVPPWSVEQCRRRWACVKSVPL